jgi:hypothetical protein
MLNKKNKKNILILEKNIDNYIVKTGRLIKNSDKKHNYNLKFPIFNYKNYKREYKIKMGNSIVSKINIYKRKLIKKKIRKKLINTKYKADNNFIFRYDGNKDEVVYMDELKKKDIENILTKDYQYPGIYRNFIIDTYKIPDNKLVTVFVKNENFDRVNHKGTQLIYSGKRTKEGIIKNVKISNSYSKWAFRILTFLMLFGGLQLISYPLRWIIEKSPEILNWPILNWFKWILQFLSQTLLFLWDSFSIFGSLILTIAVTFVIYFLINYPITIGISLATILVIFFITKNK